MHTSRTPSVWVERFSGLIAPNGRVLDLACGSGRHSRLLLSKGFSVLAVDRNLSKIQDLSANPGMKMIEMDLEDGSIPEFLGAGFDGVVVTDYLHRPLLPALRNALKPGGVFVYETFAQGNEAFGRPSRPDFLLAPGELLELVDGHLQVVAFEQGLDREPRPAVRQRICAVNSQEMQKIYLG